MDEQDETVMPDPQKAQLICGQVIALNDDLELLELELKPVFIPMIQ